MFKSLKKFFIQIKNDFLDVINIRTEPTSSVL